MSGSWVAKSFFWRWLGKGAGIALAAGAVVMAAGAGEAFAACGDGIFEQGEQCDLGMSNGSGSCCSLMCTLAPVGTTCRDALDICDVAEACNGVSPSCPADGFASPMVVCRPAMWECDEADYCTGTDPWCWQDTFVPDGQPCTDDGLFCTGVEVCQGGMCTGTPPNCNDGDPCTADYCDGQLDACSNSPIPDEEQARGPDQLCGTPDDNLPLYGPDQTCGTGDDLTGDGVCVDNCSQAFNPDQKESDRDGQGDACDTTPCRVRSLYVLSLFDLWRVDPLTGAAQPFPGMYASPQDVAVDPNEDFSWVTDYVMGRVVRTNLLNGAVLNLPDLMGPWGIDRDPFGNLWIAERDGGRITIWTDFDPWIVAEGLSQPAGLDMNDAGTQLYVTEYGNGQLTRINTMTGVSEMVTAGLNAPIAVELGSMETDAYVLESTTGSLVRVNVASGAIVPIAVNAFINPHGLTLNADKTIAFVTDQMQPPGVFYAVNLSNGATTLIETPAMEFPSGIQLGPKPPLVVSLADNISGPSGSNVPVAVMVDDLTGLEVYAADLTVRWNPSVLAATGVTPGSLTMGCSVGSNLATAGQAVISIFCTSPLSGAGSLASIDFLVTGVAGKGTPLQLTSVMLNEGRPSVCSNDGSLFAPVSISGDVRYYRDHATSTEPSSRPVNDVQVNVFNLSMPGYVSTFTGCGGDFLQDSLMPVQGYQLLPRKQGDILGAVDPYDASLNAQHVLGLTSLTPWQRLAADASGNGSLSSFDSSLIARLSVGLISQLPVASLLGNDWTFVPVPQVEPNQSVTLPVPSTSQEGSIHYTPLIEPAENQDFVAILYGDVSGNWQPVCPMGGLIAGGTGSAQALRAGPPGGAALSSADTTAATGGRLILPDLVVKPGQTISVPLRSEGLGAAVSFYLDLRFDPRVLSLKSAQAGSAASRFVFTPNTSQVGRGRLALYSPTAIGADGDIAVLTFKVVGKSGSRTTLDLSNWTVNEGKLPASVTQGSVSVKRTPVLEQQQ